ncbi:AraC family transcriptional regulator [Paenibacillus physcomitrellae]|uniref:AraC family transcriptional regulator n=1 Tax=Paenibacillus physcomitrellae TaxID=1619311 RepID=A0ABQ1GEV3_9BACL|nr:helix-turn-helix domain-containing protein [Paenibacillus physcomitrellae]GGA42447.1 AraC family transcriptional regulator [Paenibacillus physcomitrellae]
MNHNPIQPAMGILRHTQANEKFRLARLQPAPALKPFIKHYWIAQWNLNGQAAYDQEVVPNPCVNMVVERGNTFFYAPSAQKYAHRLDGSGAVFGVKFHPGGFYPFLRGSVSGLQGQPLPPFSILGVKEAELEQLLLPDTETAGDIGTMEDTDEDKAKKADQLFMAVLPAEDPQIHFIRWVVTYIAEHQELSRVEQLCSAFDCNIRTLQRLFGQYVGLSPKTVIRLYRLQNAAEAMDKGQIGSLLNLSMELGYHDQAHFIKDFKAVIGLTPEQYIRSKI